MKTHEIINELDCTTFLGNGSFFSWIVEVNEDGSFDVSTIYGNGKVQCQTLSEMLHYIGYQKGVSSVWD